MLRSGALSAQRRRSGDPVAVVPGLATLGAPQPQVVPNSAANERRRRDHVEAVQQGKPAQKPFGENGIGLRGSEELVEQAYPPADTTRTPARRHGGKRDRRPQSSSTPGRWSWRWPDSLCAPGPAWGRPQLKLGADDRPAARSSSCPARRWGRSWRPRPRSAQSRPESDPACRSGAIGWWGSGGRPPRRRVRHRLSAAAKPVGQQLLGEPSISEKDCGGSTLATPKVVMTQLPSS